MASLDKAIAPYTKSTRNNCAMCYVEIESLGGNIQACHLADKGNVN